MGKAVAFFEHPRRDVMKLSGYLSALMGATALTMVAGAPALAGAAKPATPIEHVVIIFGENISFDHYFGTYPNATNPNGEPKFVAKANTPTPNNFISTPTLLTNNPNLNPANGAGATNPFRLDRT